MSRPDWGIGIIGLGDVANLHLEAYRKIGLNVIGGAELDARKRDMMKEKWKLSVVVEDFKELISRPEVKIVDVALPQIFKIRKPIIEYASQQGKALFVQKPLSIYLSEAKQLVEIAESHRVPFMVNQNSVFVPSFMAMDPYLRDSRYIGTPYYFQIENTGWWFPKDKWLMKLDRHISSGLGIHYYALAIHWFGDWESVYAMVGRDASQTGLKGDSLGIVSVKFKNGVKGLIINNVCYRGSRIRRHEIIIQGDAGSITGDSEDICITTVNPPSEIRPKIQGKWEPDAFANSMSHFVDSLDKGTSFLFSGRENLKTVALLEAIYLSAAERREVRSDELLP